MNLRKIIVLCTISCFINLSAMEQDKSHPYAASEAEVVRRMCKKVDVTFMTCENAFVCALKLLNINEPLVADVYEKKLDNFPSSSSYDPNCPFGKVQEEFIPLVFNTINIPQLDFTGVNIRDKPIESAVATFLLAYLMHHNDIIAGRVVSPQASESK